MNRFIMLATLLAAVGARGATLGECIADAEANYPVIKKYALIDQTQELELSDINKGWLPRLSLYAQGSVQNVVPSFPATLSQMIDLPGLGKVQYKVGLDATQTIWDGGASAARRDIVRHRADAEKNANVVEMYAIRQRVQSIYFAILLLEAQMEQTRSALGVYESNLQRLNAMIANGVAMQCDADQVEVQMLELQQQLIKAQSANKGYRQVLSIFTARNLSAETLEVPQAEIPLDTTSNRPELHTFDARMALNNAQRRLADAATMPKVGFFAQSYYGYPGIDYFKAMSNRNLSFNLLAGVKITWNVDAFYTKRNALNKLSLANQIINTERETFELNNALQSASQLQEIEGIRSSMESDHRIVALRHRVRLAAEAQLQDGIIDATALTMKINDENQAQLAAAYHRIQYIQAIYNLKNTLNR